MAHASICINPVTLQFSDPELEADLISQKFKRSYSIYKLVMLYHSIIHGALPIFEPDVAMMSATYLPICCSAIIARHYFAKLPDQNRAHELFVRLWFLLMGVGHCSHRGMVYSGLQPPVGPISMLSYMIMVMLEVVVMHMMHFPFAHRVSVMLVIFLSMGTVGLCDDWPLSGGIGLSVFGQPYDALSVTSALLIGFTLGHCIELMLRTTFIDTFAVRSAVARCNRTLHTDVASEMHKHNFEVLGLLGRGSSADVFLVRRASCSVGLKQGSGTEELFALKRLSKSKQLRVERVFEECRILRMVCHPFIVRLEDAFETDQCFYYAMTYAAGGDLTMWIDHFTESAAREVTAEVLLALEYAATPMARYLHSLSIIYRDLKLENTLIGLDGHVLLSDFGVSRHAAATITIVGTPNYMPPEQYTGDSYSFYVDYWAAAVMLHEMLTGCTIGDRNMPDIAEIDEGLMTAPARDLLVRMLAPERSMRLGCGEDGLAAVKADAYFDGVDWEALMRKESPGPLMDESQRLDRQHEIGARTLCSGNSRSSDNSEHTTPSPFQTPQQYKGKLKTS